MEIQKYRPITAHIHGHAKVEKVPAKQGLSQNVKRTYNVIPQSILVKIKYSPKTKWQTNLSVPSKKGQQSVIQMQALGSFPLCENFRWKSHGKVYFCSYQQE